MGRFEFAELLYENLILYFIILIVLGFIYYKVFKRLYLFLVDPFIITQIFSLFASTVVVFLYAIGEIEGYYFLQFVVTQIAFWIGLYRYNFKYVKRSLLKKDTGLSHTPSKKLEKQTKFVFVYVSILFVVLQLIVYVKMGIPLFLNSRLTLYEGSGGWGFLGKVLDILNVIVVFGSLYIKYYFKNNHTLKNFAVLMLIFVAITYILSGSKSSIINLFSFYFLFLLMYEPQKIKSYKRYERYAVLITIVSALFVFTIHSDESPVLSFLDRVVGSGDVFYQGYYDEKINKIEGNAVTLLFTDILGTYRIVSWDNLPKPIGMQLYSMVYNVDLSMGANARHNYLGLICFGFIGSIVFSYLLGCLVSYIRSKLYFKFYSKGFLVVTFYILLLQGVNFVETDFTMFVSRLNSIIITYSFLIFSITFLFALSYLGGSISLKFQNGFKQNSGDSSSLSTGK